MQAMIDAYVYRGDLARVRGALARDETSDWDITYWPIVKRHQR
jgi:hypothetical protein